MTDPTQAIPTGGSQRVVADRSWLLDVGVASLMVVAGLLTAGPAGGATAGYRDPDGTAYALVLASTLPYCLRRRFPLAVLVVATSVELVPQPVQVPAGQGASMSVELPPASWSLVRLESVRG